MNLTTVKPLPRKDVAQRRVAIWAASLLTLAVAAAALVGGRMSYVPADLDLATQQMTQGGHFGVSYEPTNTPPPLNQLQTWTLTVTTPDGRPVEGAQITVDGDMPGHGHGLPTQPEVTQDLGEGRYLVEGMKFQMGGWWVVDFIVTAGGMTDQARFNLLLEAGSDRREVSR